MESKSHFLAHFIPGMLLGSVVGLAFGSLLVASQIPHASQTVVQTPEPTPAGTTSVRPTPHEQNLVSVSNAKTNFALNYSTDAELFEKPVITEVACGAYLPPAGFDAWPVEPSTVTVNGHEYQLYVVEGAAAGTSYTTPYYFTNVNGTCVEAHWTYAQVNCLNYDSGADREACMSKNSQIVADSDFIVTQFNYIND